MSTAGAQLITLNGQRELNTPWRLAAGASAGICSVGAHACMLSSGSTQFIVAYSGHIPSAYRAEPLPPRHHPFRAQLDLVRSRLSIASASLGGGLQHDRVLVEGKTGIVEMTKRVYREEKGLRGLYRGLMPTVVVRAGATRLRQELIDWTGRRSLCVCRHSTRSVVTHVRIGRHQFRSRAVQLLLAVSS
jgi:hypothetical protein